MDASNIRERLAMLADLEAAGDEDALELAAQLRAELYQAGVFRTRVFQASRAPVSSAA